MRVLRLGRKHWAGLALWWLVPIGSGLAFAALAIAAGLVTPFPGEDEAFSSLQRMRSAGLDNVALVVSWTASAAVGAVTLVAIAVAFAVARRREEATAALLLLGVEGVGYLVKLLVARPRPLTMFGIESHHTSFPSGHSLHIFLLFGFLVYLLEGQVQPRWLARTLQATMAVPIVVVGLSRVYLGEHWPSDIAGGYLLGAAGLGLTIWAAKRFSLIGHKT